MKLILRSDVSGLGNRGDVVDVATGYGRNYLLPKGLAYKATDGGMAQAESMRRATQQQDEEARSAAEELATKVVPRVIEINARTDENGTMFGSVTIAEIADAVLAQTEIELNRDHFDLEAPLKELGTHYVMVRPHPEVAFPVTVELQAMEY